MDLSTDGFLDQWINWIDVFTANDTFMLLDLLFKINQHILETGTINVCHFCM